MKKYIFGSFLIISLFIIMIGCRDNCRMVTCDNGYCSDGDCVCDEGWTGSNCDQQKQSYIMVWNSSSIPCASGCGSTIYVYVDDSYAGSISTYYSNEPSCSSSGAVTVNVTPGYHTIKAWCSVGNTSCTNWTSAQYYVPEGTCFKLQLYN